jgi:hypothetical protein
VLPRMRFEKARQSERLEGQSDPKSRIGCGPGHASVDAGVGIDLALVWGRPLKGKGQEQKLPPRRKNTFFPRCFLPQKPPGTAACDKPTHFRRRQSILPDSR